MKEEVKKAILLLLDEGYRVQATTYGQVYVEFDGEQQGKKVWIVGIQKPVLGADKLDFFSDDEAADYFLKVTGYTDSET